MQDLKLQTTLPALSFDAEALKAWALSLTEKYMGLVVTEDAVTAAKKDMAELNKAKKSIDDARKEAVRRVSEPIRAFEAQIREVCAIFDTAYQGLAQQVKAFEDKEREEKRNKIHELIGDCFAEKFGTCGGEWPDFEIPVQDKWLNKTTSLKSIREDIAAIIERHMEEEQRRKALEQAQQERAAAIETAVEAACARHGVKLAVSLFMVPGNLNLETRLADIQSAIDKCAADEAARQKAASQAAARPAEPRPAPAPDAPDKVMSVLLTYAPANEQSVRAALEQLRKLCSSFSVRTR